MTLGATRTNPSANDAMAAAPPTVNANPVVDMIHAGWSPPESRQYSAAPATTVMAATTGNRMPIRRRRIRWSMNGCAESPDSAAVGDRKKPPMIAPPNQTIADPMWTTRRSSSHQSNVVTSFAGRELTRHTRVTL